MVDGLRECQELTFVWDNKLGRYREARDLAPEPELLKLKGDWASFDKYKKDCKTTDTATSTPSLHSTQSSSRNMPPTTMPQAYGHRTTVSTSSSLALLILPTMWRTRR